MSIEESVSKATQLKIYTSETDRVGLNVIHAALQKIHSGEMVSVLTGDFIDVKKQLDAYREERDRQNKIQQYHTPPRYYDIRSELDQAFLVAHSLARFNLRHGDDVEAEHLRKAAVSPEHDTFFTRLNAWEAENLSWLQATRKMGDPT